MTGKSKQLSGTGKDRYLDRLIGDEPDVPADAAERLAAKAKAEISSVRVRRDVALNLRPVRRTRRNRTAGQDTPAAAPEPDATPPSAPAAEIASPPLSDTHEPLPAPAAPHEHAAPIEVEPAPAPAALFDPYAFGLVPVFQREGRDGLLARLATVSEAAHLRLMAQKQQISLRAELRTGDIALRDLREAIIAAVEKRIADRSAAAQ